MGFVERKCKILTLKVRYTFFAGHPVDNTKIKENNSAKKKDLSILNPLWAIVKVGSLNKAVKFP